MKKCLALISFIPLLSMAQTGPGGVGTNDGSSSLEFWYMAEGEPYAGGDFVESVSDHSGNSRTLTASGVERPSYVAITTTGNNMPSFAFAPTEELETTYVGNSNENMSFGIAMSYISVAGNNNVAIQHGGRNILGADVDHFFSDFAGGTLHTSATVASSGVFTYHARTFANTGTDRLKYYIDNTNTENFDHVIEDRTSNTWIGGHGTGGGTGWRGRIAEVFKFSRVI